MTAFATWFAESSFPLLLEQHGERVTYYPRGGGSRSIDAIVDREPPAVFDSTGKVIKTSYIVRVFNDCVTGILSRELNTGGDELELIPKLGGAVPEKRPIVRLISQDSGVTQLAIE